MLQRLGPVFVKIGQFLALRPDLVPQEYCNELLKLVDRVPPVAWASIREIAMEDLRADLDEVFEWINPTPLAAASLAQVHIARTKDGSEVAVKIQRPGIREQVENDLKRLSWLFKLLRISGVTSVISLGEAQEELRRWLHEELNFELELRNLTRMYELNAESQHSVVPRPYPELSGKRIVTAGYLHGVPFSELLRLIREGEAERIEALGFERDVLAENLLNTVLTQIFKHNCFHADTHPGNLVALPSNIIGFVDFGLVEQVNETVREGQRQFLSAVYSGSIEGMHQALVNILITRENSDLDSFRSDFFEGSRVWMRERESVADIPPEESTPIARYMVSVIRSARRNRLELPTEVLSMYRTLLTAESVAHQLGGTEDLRSVGRHFFIELQVEDALGTLMPEQMQALSIDLLTLLRESPGNLNRIISDLAEGRQVFHLRTSDSNTDRRAANHRARLLSLAVISVGLAVLMVGASNIPFLNGLPVKGSLLVLLVAAYIWMAVLWSRLS
jgi:ubiquinone biosynthesis protein